MSEKFAFIDVEKATRNVDGSFRYTITQMCTWLAVSLSGFYEWSGRPASARDQRRARLKVLVAAIFARHERRYGYRRIHAELARSGYSCSPELVRDLVRELGLVACYPKRKRTATTVQAKECAQIPDLVNRDFTAAVPGAKLVGDITYVRTWQGWEYLALVTDCASRKIVGWAMGENYKTPLITAAIRMAAANLVLPDGAVFHSDRGSNYTSEEYALVLEELGIKRSVGRTGICYDNALSESVNGALKVELINRVEYATREHARADVGRYIELYYNTQRLHSTLGYKTPQEVMDEYHQNHTAA